MATPRAPRKSIGGVDVQLEEFETDLRAALEIQLIMNTHMVEWNELDRLADVDNAAITRVIDLCFMDMAHRYSAAPQVSAVLEHCRILIQNVVWAAMNVALPPMFHNAWNAGDAHIERVIDNAMAVYNRVIYAHLRTEMIMANHNAEVLQRTWRRCITDPKHPACRRRLMYEFGQVTNLDPNSF
jgi:hypothetical protein